MRVMKVSCVYMFIHNVLEAVVEIQYFIFLLSSVFDVLYSIGFVNFFEL